ncbi:DNA alkylation repair protein [Patescibacteria group bacterium]|nr:DNA alkylation repair protein [Patescibacteria group bacterium]
MTTQEIIKELQKKRNPVNIAGMARFGIKPKKEPLGIAMPTLRKISKEIKHAHQQPQERHELATKLWKTGIYEARLIAAFIEDPELISEKQMETWVADFDNWAICDTVCGTVFDRTPLAYEKALEWTKRQEEYVKRAGFTIGAWLTVHDKKAKDSDFYPFLKAIKEEAADERIYVKKAVNWALRQIGKSRNRKMNILALKTANEIKKIDSKAARWIASDAIRELNSPAIQKRFKD